MTRKDPTCWKHTGDGPVKLPDLVEHLLQLRAERPETQMPEFFSYSPPVIDDTSSSPNGVEERA